MTTYFFSIDWGTSSLRVRFVGANDHDVQIFAETVNSYGCAHVYDLWKNTKANTSQEAFFLDFLKIYLSIPLAEVNPQDIPVVISGMASSSIGIRELPYANVPFPLNGEGSIYAHIDATSHIGHPVILLSGLATTNDVMRGEEAQLLGLLNYFSQHREAICILPGTHSKHIYIQAETITGFKTYITGELFHLLSIHSLLKNSVGKSNSIIKEAFAKGVYDSKGNILHNTFTIRANSLLHSSIKEANYNYLSGLLIGTEMRELLDVQQPIYIFAHDNLIDAYTYATELLNLQQRCTVISSEEVDHAVIHGQLALLQTI